LKLERIPFAIERAFYKKGGRSNESK
jgi:hypothetical protein